MKVQKFLLLIWGFLTFVHLVYAGEPFVTPQPPLTYWAGAGDTPSMEYYRQEGRYLRFTHFPVKVLLLWQPGLRWQAAFDGAIDQLNAVVPIEQTANILSADIVMILIPSQRFAALTPCDVQTTDGCGVIRPLGRPGEAGFRAVGLAWVRADASLPPEHLLLHELIHALGILVHSPYPEDVMYNGDDAAATLLSPRDRATLTYLYRQPALEAAPQKP